MVAPTVVAPRLARTTGASLDTPPSRGAAVTLSPGTRLGPYEIQAAVGAGGMGEVYKAKDTRLERSVAIKVLPAHLGADPKRRARFAREAKAIAGLNHRHICALHDVGREGDVDFLVMVIVDGTRLASTYPVAKALEHAIQIVDALRAPAPERRHPPRPEAGERHGDAGRTGQGPRLRLGEAPGRPGSPRSGDGQRAIEASLTRHGVPVGQSRTCRPSRWKASRWTRAPDIFSFGAVLYELLTAQRAFQGDSAISTMSAILHETPVGARKVRHEVPRRLEAILNRCPRKSRDARYASAGRLARGTGGRQSFGRSTGFQALLQPRVAASLLLVLVVSIAAAAWFGVRVIALAGPATWRFLKSPGCYGPDPASRPFRLAREAQRVLPEDRGLQQLCAM